MSKLVGLIPSRIGSERLPNKPLKLIQGFPMFYHVYKRAILSNLDEVFLCTDSELIIDSAKKYDIPTILTSSKHKNGSERIGEAANKINLKNEDLIINIHGDEPLLDPLTINTLSSFYYSNDFDIVFPHLSVEVPVKNNINSVKIVTNQSNRVLYLSRNLIPGGFQNLSKIKKQCGITSFTKKILDYYNSLDPSVNEKIEQIELLRALDNSLVLGSVEIKKHSISVDTQKDLNKVRKLMLDDIVAQKYLD